MHVCKCNYKYRHTLRLAIGTAIAIYYGNNQLLSIFNSYYYQHAKCTSAHWIDQAIIIIYLYLLYNMQNLKAHFQISSIANPSMTVRCSHGDLPMTCRWPAGDRRNYCRPTATGRRPGSHRRGACRSPSGHQPKIMSSAEKIGRSPNSHPAAAGRRPLPDLYDMVQGRKNPVMICRCQKTGIGGKSGDHRTIYKACDVGISGSYTCDCPISWIGAKCETVCPFGSSAGCKDICHCADPNEVWHDHWKMWIWMQGWPTCRLYSWRIRM